LLSIVLLLLKYNLVASPGVNKSFVGAVRFTFSLEEDQLVDVDMVTAADG
jgi:hypothetical protein